MRLNGVRQHNVDITQEVRALLSVICRCAEQHRKGKAHDWDAVGSYINRISRDCGYRVEAITNNYRTGMLARIECGKCLRRAWGFYFSPRHEQGNEEFNRIVANAEGLAKPLQVRAELKRHTTTINIRQRVML